MLVSNVTRKYLIYIKQKQCSSHTLTAYNLYLKRFSQFCAGMRISEVKAPTVQKFYDTLAKEDLAINTQNYHVHAVRSLLKYCYKFDIEAIDARKIEVAKEEESQIEFLEKEEVDKLISGVDVTTIRGVRDLAIIEFLYSTGLRISEATSLNQLDINIQRKELYVVGKGKKGRMAFLTDRAKTALWNYIQIRKDNHQALFISYKGRKTRERRLTPEAIQSMVKKLAKKVGIQKKVTPHVLRHSFATTLLINGADLMSIKEMLGHSRLSSTQVYLHCTNKRLQETHSKFMKY